MVIKLFPSILFRRLTLVAALILVFGLSSPSARSETAPIPLSIEGLINQTLGRNPELQFYKAEIEVAKAGQAKAGKPLNPQLDLAIGQKRIRSGDARSEGLAYSVALTQPIEWPGRLGLRKAIADRDIALAQLGLERFSAFLAARVKVLAYALATQQENASAAAEVADRFTAVREVIVQREPGGVTPILETKIIEAAEISIQRRAGEAAIEMQKALLELNQLMGRRADSPLQVRRTEFPTPKPESLVSLLNLAASNNYDLRVRRAELEQQGFKVSLARNEQYPTFTVGPNLSQERAGDRETVVGLSFSIPLPLWENGQAAINASQARQLQAEASLQTSMREVERQITEAWMLLSAQQKRINGGKPDSLKSFADAAQLADRHYRLGAVPLITYLEMQEKYLEATEAINATRLEVLHAALELDQLVGSSGPKSSNK